jgi:hypothetical protein
VDQETQSMPKDFEEVLGHPKEVPKDPPQMQE